MIVAAPDMTPSQHRLMMAVELAAEQACADPAAATLTISRSEAFEVLVSLASTFIMVPVPGEADVGPEVAIANAESIIRNMARTFARMSADDLAAALPSIITGFQRSFVA